jgi:transposase InsO family protein
VIEMLLTDYPISLLCQVIGLPRSSYYYRAVERDETQLRATLDRLGARFPTYGARRLTAQTKREEPHLAPLGRKRVRRLMRELGLKVRRKKSTHRTTDSNHSFPRYENLVSGLAITHPDHVWVCDITYVKLGSGEFVYLAIVLDVFTRAIRGWALSHGLGVELTLGALHRALLTGRPEIHHSDQGVQYAATDYVTVLEAAQVRISMAEVGHAEQNGYAERVIRTIKEEEVYLTEYRDYEEALAQIGRFIDDVYLTKRIHSSLGYVTPAEYEAQWRKEQTASIL